MPSDIQYLTHQFSGGWATDFGPTYYGAPDGPNFKLPWLNTATNVVYEFDGGPRKAPGTNKLNASVIEAAQTVTGVYDYWRLGTGSTPTQRRVVHVNDKIYHDGGTGSFSSLTTGLEVGTIPHYSTFNDLLIIGSNSTTDVPKSWDQSTFQTLAGSPPRFSFSVKHQGKQWAAGNWTVPYRLYYSVTGNPEDWTSTGSGSIDVDPGDGDRIVGLFSWRNDLWVFKGPNKLSIHRITGATPSTFARTTFIEGISAANQSCIFSMGNDFGFVSPRGTIHTMKAVQDYGDYLQAYSNYPILSWCRDNMNLARAPYWQTATDFARGYSLITFPLAGTTNNTRCLMLDWRFLAQGEPYPRWALWDFGSFASLCQAMDTNQRLRVFAGGYDGYVYRLDQSDRTHNSTSINYDVMTPYLTYGSEVYKKTLFSVGIGLAPKNTNTATFAWSADGGTAQTTTFAQQGGGFLLGTSVLGTDSLGGAAFNQTFLELETGGEGRAFQYRLTENNDASDIEMHNFIIGLMPSGVSTENS
ncbi:MAG: hypothetical protein ABT940_00410 [Alphaproteobacteria bacterium]